MKSKALVTIFAIFFSVFCQAQNLKSQLYVDEGIKSFQLGNMEKADSLFNIALEVYPNVDAYFNKGLVRLNMKDQCGFCENMYKAAFYGDIEADSLYHKFCVTTTTMLKSAYDSLVPFIPNKTYEIIKKDRCDERDRIDFYDAKDSLLATLEIIEGRYFYSGLSYKARYPGGQKSLDNFISNNLVYPKEAYEQKIQGKVYASFVIDEKGKVRDARVVSGVHPLLDQAALDVIRQIPKWYPATKKGKAVREIITLNVSFSI